MLYQLEGRTEFQKREKIKEVHERLFYEYAGSRVSSDTVDAAPQKEMYKAFDFYDLSTVLLK